MISSSSTHSNRDSFKSWFGKSILFMIIIRLWSWVKAKSSRSPAVKASDWLSNNNTNSASIKAFFDRSTPIRSTTSSVSRIPAVSTNFKGTPRILIYSSTVSRVVPSISVTMAFSSLNKAFSKEDFPTFGRPTMAVEIPSRKIFPCLAVDNKPSIRSLIIVVFSPNNLRVISSTSSYSG